MIRLRLISGIRQLKRKDKLVNVSVDRQVVKDSPAYDTTTMVDRAYEDHFHSYYRDIGPSDQR